MARERISPVIENSPSFPSDVEEFSRQVAEQLNRGSSEVASLVTAAGVARFVFDEPLDREPVIVASVFADAYWYLDGAMTKVSGKFTAVTIHAKTTAGANVANGTKILAKYLL